MYAARSARCPHCQTVFHGVDANEDGSPYLEATKCATPTCDVYLCGATCQELSFSCDGCGRRHCNEHLILVPDGTDKPLKCCAVCARECRIEPVPIRPVYQEVA